MGDGVYLKAGIADDKLCALVIIGVNREGKKRLMALAEGYRESKESLFVFCGETVFKKVARCLSFWLN